MIPRQMEAFLREHLPEHTWQDRLRQEEGRASLEFGPGDIERLPRLRREHERPGPRPGGGWGGGGGASRHLGPADIERRAPLGIEADRLGPRLVACLWDEETPLEVGGYLVVDNLSMGRPSMGGIRMRPDLTPAAAFKLARAMTLKKTPAPLPP